MSKYNKLMDELQRLENNPRASSDQINNVKMEIRTLCTVCGNRYGEERYSFGIYAGRMCDECWKDSGLKDEGPEGFDPMDAGENYDE